MQEVESWFYTLIVRGDQEGDADYWARVLKGVKTRLVESCLKLELFDHLNMLNEQQADQ